MSTDVAHVPQVVDAGRLSDRRIMEALLEFTRSSQSYRTRSSMTVSDVRKHQNILDGGVVLAGEAWRRGMLDPFLLSMEE